jgi:hypothetical protein
METKNDNKKLASDEERTTLLATPIKDLGLTVEGSPLEAPIRTLYRDLERVGIVSHPPVYLSDEWGCPDGVPVIGVPFYLARRDLQQLEASIMHDLESAEEVLRIFRHEAGHAFNYAHRLFEAPRWRELFGAFDDPYREYFAARTDATAFVRHLPGWYAEKHPDEDFAETFAVAITPDSDWQRVYRGTAAYDKLAYVAECIDGYGPLPLPVISEGFDTPLSSMTATVGEWYEERLLLRRARTIVVVFPSAVSPEHADLPRRVARGLVGLEYQAALVSEEALARPEVFEALRERKPAVIFALGLQDPDSLARLRILAGRIVSVSREASAEKIFFRSERDVFSLPLSLSSGEAAFQASLETAIAAALEETER